MQFMVDCAVVLNHRVELGVSQRNLRVQKYRGSPFDENEYYSEYDFLEDSLYHGGTGLLGQPSLIYGTTINAKDAQRYYLLQLLGHGHHSGATGNLTLDVKTISTARYIVERIVVGMKEHLYQ